MEPKSYGIGRKTNLLVWLVMRILIVTSDISNRVIKLGKVLLFGKFVRVKENGENAVSLASLAKTGNF
jgi:hypothetical protein